MGNLAQNLLDTAEKQGSGSSLRMDDSVLTYTEFRDAALRVAGALREHGVATGDRVGLVLPNVLSFPVVFYGALLVGAAVVPITRCSRRRRWSTTCWTTARGW